MTEQEKNITLKEAIAKKKLEQFIEQQSDKKGDKIRFDSTLSSMASQKSPKAHQPFSPDDSES